MLPYKIQLKKKSRRGFTMIEMLIYLSLTILISTILIQSLVTVFKSNRSSFVDMNLRNSAYSAMESMVQNIRGGEAIDYAHSTLYPSKAGILQFDETDGSGNTNVIEFATSSTGTLNFYLGSTTPALVGPLTLNGTKVTQLIFTPIELGTSTAVRIQMTLSATVAGVTKTSNFFSTIILRGSY